MTQTLLKHRPPTRFGFSFCLSVYLPKIRQQTELVLVIGGNWQRFHLAIRLKSCCWRLHSVLQYASECNGHMQCDVTTNIFGRQFKWLAAEKYPVVQFRPANCFLTVLDSRDRANFEARLERSQRYGYIAEYSVTKFCKVPETGRNSGAKRIIG